MIGPGGPGRRVTYDQSSHCADYSDRQALQHKNIANLRAKCAERHQDRDVARAIGDRHRQHDQNIQSGDECNQSYE